MARYKATAKLYVDDRLINAGQEFESNTQPGKKWLPIDDEARSKVGSQPVLDRRNREIPDASAKEAEKQTARDDVEKKAARDAGQKRASPGKSVAQQQTDGEEPTVGAIHDNEELKAKA